MSEHCFCASFCMAHANINFIRLPTLEKLKQGVEASFVHGAYFADSIMIARQKLKAREGGQEKTAFSLNVRKSTRI